MSINVNHCHTWQVTETIATHVNNRQELPLTRNGSCHAIPSRVHDSGQGKNLTKGENHKGTIHVCSTETAPNEYK